MHAIRQRPFQVNPGDSFSTTCIYDRKSPTEFGKKSIEEMCLFSILYYPAKEIFGQRQWACGVGIPLKSCNATLITDQYALSDAQSLSPFDIDTFYERSFGSQSTNQCSLKPPLTFTNSDDEKSSSPALREANLIFMLLSASTFWRLYALLV